MPIPESRDLDHSLERMVQHACRILADVATIETHGTRHGRVGEYILRLIALEILLKAGALKCEGQLKPWKHDFPSLFSAQTEALQERVSSEFGARGLGRFPETGGSLEEQLSQLRKNYTRARYLYEPSLPLTVEERVERERLFLREELPVEEWDIVYHVGLIELLTSELLAHLKQWVPEWLSETGRVVTKEEGGGEAEAPPPETPQDGDRSL